MFLEKLFCNSFNGRQASSSSSSSSYVRNTLAKKAHGLDWGVQGFWFPSRYQVPLGCLPDICASMRIDLDDNLFVALTITRMRRRSCGLTNVGIDEHVRYEVRLHKPRGTSRAPYPRSRRLTSNPPSPMPKNDITTPPPTTPLAAPPSPISPRCRRRRSAPSTTSSNSPAPLSTNSTSNPPPPWPSSAACCLILPKMSSWRCCICLLRSRRLISMRG